ncbi:MAG: zinc dependent phospholipase C family protein [Treponema sp.]|nr:zinc dependent phospholipase C family protein [Treponema sp.]
MAKIIYGRIRRNGMNLRRFPFVLGNLVPDLCLSFIFRRHEYARSALSVRKIILRLYEGRFDPRSVLFAYCMGIINHYVCDYFCYSHSPAFRGNLRDHIKYEWDQHISESENFSFFERENHGMDFCRLMDILDDRIRNHDHDLAQNPAAAKTDIAAGTAVAEWLTGTVFYSAERFFLTVQPRHLFRPERYGEAV